MGTLKQLLNKINIIHIKVIDKKYSLSFRNVDDLQETIRNLWTTPLNETEASFQRRQDNQSCKNHISLI